MVAVAVIGGGAPLIRHRLDYFVTLAQERWRGPKRLSHDPL
jgi:hypothetical protein